MLASNCKQVQVSIFRDFVRQAGVKQVSSRCQAGGKQVSSMEQEVACSATEHNEVTQDLAKGQPLTDVDK